MNVLYFLTPKSQIKCVTTNMSLRQVLEVVEHYRYTVIPLLDENGFYVGAISEGDLLFYLKEHPFKTLDELNKTNILEVKRNRDYLPVKASVQMDEIILTAANQNFVPILDDRKHFIGIITRKQIINYLYLNKN